MSEERYMGSDQCKKSAVTCTSGALSYRNRVLDNETHYTALNVASHAENQVNIARKFSEDWTPADKGSRDSSCTA